MEQINEKEENSQDWDEAQIRVEEAQKWSARRETNRHAFAKVINSDTRKCLRSCDTRIQAGLAVR
jgi:hypothetical protein